MPINKPMMKSMKEEYWKEKWEKIYYAVEMKNKWIKPKKKGIKRRSPHDKMVEA